MTDAARPNIVFILLDDLGWRDLGCYGSTFYETPNLDRLAAEGMRFSDAYASAPICSPTRASVMTGKYPATVNITNWIPGNPWGRLMGVPYLHALPKSETTIAAALRGGVYRTWHVGKWHLGPAGHWPEDFGFDVNIGGCDRGSPPAGYFSPYNIPTLPDGPAGEYLTDRLTDEAVRLIESAGDRPYFLNLWHYAVHTPIQAPAPLVEKYERKAARLGLDKVDALVEGEHHPALHKRDQRVQRRVVQSHATYAGMIENLDQNVGRLMAAIERSPRGRETIVIFTSDNGGLSSAEGSPTCNAPLAEGKGWMYDGGVREPLIAWWPGVIRGGAVCDVPVTSTDFFPTFLDAAGLPPMPQQHVDGVSLMPLLRESGGLDREAIFWHYPHYSNQGGTPACAVRVGDWKLIEFFEDGRLELYNLRQDVSESTDLAAREPQRAAELHAKLVEWRRATAARVPERNPQYDQMVAGRVPSPDGLGRLP